MNRPLHNATISPYSHGLPQVMVFTSGIQIVVRNIENEITRLYYFSKAATEKPSKLVYFHDHTASTPYEFDFCWDVRAKTRLSDEFVVNEYKADGLNKIMFQYYTFGIEVSIDDREEQLQTSCLLKSSNFSRQVDQQMVIDLVSQSLPVPEIREGRATVTVSSRKRSSHHDWLHWKSGDVLAIPLNYNGKEVGCLKAKNLLAVEMVQ